MQVQVKGFLCYDTSKYVESEAARWRFMHYDPRQFNDAEKIVVREGVILEAEAPDDFDPRGQQIEILREQERVLRAAFAAKVADIQQQINSLLALENAA